jgi:hypothetical protein
MTGTQVGTTVAVREGGSHVSNHDGTSNEQMDCCKCCLLDAIGGGEQQVHLQAIVAKARAKDWHVRKEGDVMREA